MGCTVVTIIKGLINKDFKRGKILLNVFVFFLTQIAHVDSTNIIRIERESCECLRTLRTCSQVHACQSLFHIVGIIVSYAKRIRNKYIVTS